MYTITMNQLSSTGEELFFDPRLKEYAIFNATLTREENKIATMQFTIYPSHPQFDNIALVTTEFYINDSKGHIICIVRPISKKVKMNGGIEYQCEEITGLFANIMTTPMVYELGGDIIHHQLAQRIASVTRTYRDYILPATQYRETSRTNMPYDPTWDFVTTAFDTDDNDYLAVDVVEPMWEVLRTLTVEGYGVGYLTSHYFRAGENYMPLIPITPASPIREKTANINFFTLGYLLEDELKISEQEIVFGKNLEDIFIETSIDDFYTRLWPIGEDVSTSKADRNKGAANKWPLTIENATNRAEWDEGAQYPAGWLGLRSEILQYGPIDKQMKFDKVKNANTLYTKAAEVFLSRPQTPFSKVVTLTGRDLVDAGVDISNIEFMTRVKCTSLLHGISDYYIVSRHIINFTNPTQSKIELGATQKSLTDITYENSSKASKAVFNLDDRIYGLENS